MDVSGSGDAPAGAGYAAPHGTGRSGRGLPSLRRKLETLKHDYVTAYAELHRRLVLGPQADQRRARLYDDARLQALKQLARIDLLPRAELDGWEQAITGLPTCLQFHEGAIDDSPTCPYCHLRPAQRGDGQRAEGVLDTLDLRLDDLLESWRQALRSALESETAEESRAAMAPGERAPIEAFLQQPDEAPEIPVGFVDAATQALRGITALALEEDALLAALREGGMPCTVEELERRLRDVCGNGYAGTR